VMPRGPLTVCDARAQPAQLTRSGELPARTAPEAWQSEYPQSASPLAGASLRATFVLDKSNPATDKAALLAAVLADGTNLGLARMADASRGLGYLHLVNVAQWQDEVVPSSQIAATGCLWCASMMAARAAT
jgi:hypothetical protein